MLAAPAAVLPELAGYHHVRLPVADLERSLAWYERVLGFTRDFPFRSQERIVGWALQRNAGALRLVLMHDAAAAARCSGLALHSFEVPDRAQLERVRECVAQAGGSPATIEPALAGHKLLNVADPEGHLIGFYTAGPRVRTPA